MGGAAGARLANGKPVTARGHVKHIKVKGKKGKRSKKETYDLIVNIDLQEWKLTNEQVAEYKEVFMLFDKDEDGVLSFPELSVVMKSLGQRPSDEELLKMVQDVSEDPVYHTIEFNEFLQLLSKQQRSGTTRDSLTDAFSIFDKDDDGYIPVHEMREILQSLGDKMTDKELDEMMKAASSDREGFINYDEFVTVLCGKKRASQTTATTETETRNSKKRNSKKKNIPEATSIKGKDKNMVGNDNGGHDTNKNDDDITYKATIGISKLTVESNGNISEEAVAPVMPPNDNESVKLTDIKIQIKEDIHHVVKPEEAAKNTVVIPTTSSPISDER